MQIMGRGIGRRATAASASVVIGVAALAGCAAKSTTTPNTVLVTITADSNASAVQTTAGVTVSDLPGTSVASVSVSEPSAASAVGSVSSASEAPPSMAPIVKLDPLQAKCDKVLDAARLGSALGSLPAGAGRVVEGSNDAIQRSGRLRCQYGVSDDKSSVAVTVVLAQYTSEAAAQAQLATTASSEEQAGAISSDTFIQGHPAKILLREGGLLVLGYDTWTLSVVVENGITTDDKLPAALTSLADYALSKVLSQGG